jgi:integrase
MTTRHDNKGLRKLCEHPRRQWAKCEHPWHFNFKPRGGRPYRFSLDTHLGRHIDSKSEAEDEAAKIRMSIKAGTFGHATPRNEMTLRQLADTYLERYVAVDHANTAQEFRYSLGTICRTVVRRPTSGSAPLGDWRVADIVTDTIERFRETRLAQKTGVVGVNRNVRQLRAVFNWAIRVGYCETTPFKRGSEPVVKLAQEAKRSRRLHDGEEAALFAICAAHLRAVIDAALETGMRLGEILSLQWEQVEGLRIAASTITWLAKAEIFLPKEKTKTKRDRRIPISASSAESVGR